MKNKELETLRKESVSTLQEMLLVAHRALFDLRMQGSDPASIKSHQFKLLRRRVARILTLIREKKSEAAV